MAIPIGDPYPPSRPHQPEKPWLTDEYRAHLRSDAWKLLRVSAIARAGGRCQNRPYWLDGDRCEATTDLEVHHRHYRTLGQETLDDVIVLCELCHEQEHRQISANRLDNARFVGYATKRWGDSWPHDAYGQYEDWLRSRGGF